MSRLPTGSARPKSLISLSPIRRLHKTGKLGKSRPGYEAKIVDEKLQEVPVGEIGTLLIKGDSICAGYWNKHQKTKSTFLGQWINTDDKYYKDEEGFYTTWVAPTTCSRWEAYGFRPVEVEACLIAHPGGL